MRDSRKMRKKCNKCGRVMNSNSVKKHYKDKHNIDTSGNLQFLIEITNLKFKKS